jgi:phage gp29-like protein
MKTISEIQCSNGKRMLRQRFNPIRSLTPESLSQYLDAFHRGHLSPAALLWDAIERRDDVLKGVASKRKKCVSRLKWEILRMDDSEEAKQQQVALSFFYDHMQCVSAIDGNERGGFSLLVRQMMDCVGKKYAVHEIVYRVYGECFLQNRQRPLISAEFRHVPLWFFENFTGKLRFLWSDSEREGIALEDGAWLVSAGDGLMEACSIAYLFKHLPLRDWLVYCERNGMPGIKGTTDATPGTQQWEMAREAVESFGAEFNALMASGTDLQAIDITSRSELPYPKLIDRMDRAMAALWCGSDLSTFSRSNGTGASMQADERILLEQDDAAMISEILNEQVDRYVLKYLFDDTPVKAYVALKPTSTRNLLQELDMCERLKKLGVPISPNDLCQRFGMGGNENES